MARSLLRLASRARAPTSVLLALLLVLCGRCDALRGKDLAAVTAERRAKLADMDHPLLVTPENVMQIPMRSLLALVSTGSMLPASALLQQQSVSGRNLTQEDLQALEMENTSLSYMYAREAAYEEAGRGADAEYQALLGREAQLQSAFVPVRAALEAVIQDAAQAADRDEAQARLDRLAAAHEARLAELDRAAQVFEVTAEREADGRHAAVAKGTAELGTAAGALRRGTAEVASVLRERANEHQELEDWLNSTNSALQAQFAERHAHDGTAADAANLQRLADQVAEQVSVAAHQVEASAPAAVAPDIYQPA